MKAAIYTIIVTSFHLTVSAQQSLEHDRRFLLNHLNDRAEEVHDIDGKKSGSFALRFYKSYISSQDAMSCSFYPSCSVYGTQSIGELGLIEGFLNMFDRISRCHGMNKAYYPSYINTVLNHDPL